MIWHEAPFAVGANLLKAIEALKAKQFDEFEAMVALFQRTSARLKYGMIPTSRRWKAWPSAAAASSSCTAHRVVAALESYIGLVEVGVGLLPAGGGCKEFALRAAQAAQGGDLLPAIRRRLKQHRHGAKCRRAPSNAKEMGFLQRIRHRVVPSEELLYVALNQARALAESGYRPPLRAGAQFRWRATPGIATLKMMLVNMKEGGFISEHDYDICSRIAECLCGGDVDPGSLVDEKWLLDLERRHFVELAKTPKTQERIEHTLKTGKPLRN